MNILNYAIILTPYLYTTLSHLQKTYQQYVRKLSAQDYTYLINAIAVGKHLSKNAAVEALSNSYPIYAIETTFEAIINGDCFDDDWAEKQLSIKQLITITPLLSSLTKSYITTTALEGAIFTLYNVYTNMDGASAEEALQFTSYYQVRALEAGAAVEKALQFTSYYQFLALEAGAAVEKALQFTDYNQFLAFKAGASAEEALQFTDSVQIEFTPKDTNYGDYPENNHEVFIELPIQDELDL